MSESISNKTSSFPTVCNYQPPATATEEPTVVYEQGDFLGSMATTDPEEKKKTTRTGLEPTEEETRKEALASMKATLLKSISKTCVSMINNHREILRKQYKAQEREMEAIQRKHT
jgi:hypothetical protein